jgi:hypothetical protein
MNNGRSKTLSGPMSGLTCTAAIRNLQTDVAFGRGADLPIDVAAHLKQADSCRSTVVSIFPPSTTPTAQPALQSAEGRRNLLWPQRWTALNQRETAAIARTREKKQD